jgi:hypothetical protein
MEGRDGGRVCGPITGAAAWVRGCLCEQGRRAKEAGASSPSDTGAGPAGPASATANGNEGWDGHEGVNGGDAALWCNR